MEVGRVRVGLMVGCFLLWVPEHHGQVPEADHQEAEEFLEQCSAAEHREFDFWIGEWEVRDPSGGVAGHNTIERVANGCGLLEQWRGASGRTGVSLNWYEPRTGEWYQTWVGLGLYLRLSGGLEEGKMVLSGEREERRGAVLDRIVWTPREDGRVRQLWQLSRDGGGSWETVFDGFYARAGS